MDQWYCREPISSTLAASHLVFNIDNCVDLSKVIHTRPPRPPDSVGRECYVYVLDGASVRNIRDLPIDDLAPWNSKMCKSSTRFNAVSINPQRGDMVMRRYIVSDTDNVPECLLACYYCKHPTFKLAKKIFYACDGRREACLPGSFVVFIYEFDGAEKLYQRAYQNGSANRQASGPRRHLVDPNKVINNKILSNTPSTNALIKKPSNQANNMGFRNDISQTRQALEAAFGNGVANNLNSENGLNGFDETINTLFGNEKNLNEFFQYSQFFADNIPQIPSMRSGSPMLCRTNNLNSTTSGAKRRKISHQIYNSNRQFNLPVKIEEKQYYNTPPIGDFRYLFATKAMLENFEQNGLVNKDFFQKFYEKFNESSSLLDFNERNLGGCILLDSTIQLGKYFLTVLWFRNPTFLFRKDPVIHPVAILVSTSIQKDDYEFLLTELQSKLTSTDKIARAILASESIDFDSFSTPIRMLSFPCMRLVCERTFKNSISKRFPIEADEFERIFTEDLFGDIDESNLRNSKGLLNSLTFEDFVKQLSIVERKWPNIFQTWFREKSGWIYQRLSLGPRLKSGFSANNRANLEELITPVREGLSRRFESLISNNEFSILTSSDVLEELADEILLHSAQAIFSPISSETEVLVNNKVISKISSSVIEEEEEENESLNNSNNKNTKTLKNSLELEEDDDDAVMDDSESNLSNRNKFKNSAVESDDCSDNELAKITLHPSLNELRFTRLEWVKLSNKKEELEKIGLSSLPVCEISMDAENGLNPNLFNALSRVERIDLLKKAHDFEVEKRDTDDGERKFIVIDNAGKSCFYVSANYEINVTYCECQKQKISNFSISLVKTLICEHLCAVALRDSSFAKTLTTSFLPNSVSEIADGTASATPITVDEENGGGSTTSDNFKILPNGIKLDEAPSVEIIRCSTNNSQDTLLSEIGGALFNKNGATALLNRSNRNNSVDSIIDTLKANRKNDLQNNAPPPLLEPYDFGDASPYFTNPNSKESEANGAIIKNNNNNNTDNHLMKVENVFEMA